MNENTNTLGKSIGKVTRTFTTTHGDGSGKSIITMTYDYSTMPDSQIRDMLGRTTVIAMQNGWLRDKWGKDEASAIHGQTIMAIDAGKEPISPDKLADKVMSTLSEEAQQALIQKLYAKLNTPAGKQATIEALTSDEDDESDE